MPMPLLIWLGLIAFSAASLTGSDCTFPDGKAAAQFEPCYPNNAQSHCCARGDGCVANGFCQSGSDQQLYRGGCAGAGAWDGSSTACPRSCYRVLRKSSNSSFGRTQCSGIC